MGKKIDMLKQQLEKLEVVKKQQDDQNYTLENQLKQLQISSAASSYSTLTIEEFKQLACRVNEQYHQCMTSLYTTLCEIQELCKTFEEQSHVLEDHDTQKTIAMKALENVTGSQIHMRDKAKDIPIMDKLQVKKVKVTFETWGSICDAVRSIIKDGQEACKRRWKTSDVLFDLLGFPMQ